MNPYFVLPSLYATGVSAPNPLHVDIALSKCAHPPLPVPILIPSVLVPGLNAGNIPAGTVPYS